MKRGPTGQDVRSTTAGEEVRAFVPFPLPPDPPFDLAALQRPLERALQERPVASLQDVAARTGLSFPAASAGMKALERLAIVRELTGKRLNRLFGYERFIAILSEGTELP